MTNEWDAIWDLRPHVNKATEKTRSQGLKLIDSKLVIKAPATHPVHRFYRGYVAELFIVSTVVLEMADTIEVLVEPATGIKCDRCGRWDEFCYESKSRPSLCDRCDRVIHMGDYDAKHGSTQ